MIIDKDCIIKTDDEEIVIRPNIKATIFAQSKKITARTEENAELILITLNDATTKATLEGDHSKIKTINIYKGNNQTININATSEHIGKHTISLIKTVGILSESKATTRGLIKINESAENSDGYQKSDVLILKDSKIISVPDLEIHNDKVKCSHGSTISRMDSNKIFYLQSRGLNQEQAEEIIIEVFYESALKEINDNGIKNELREILRGIKAIN
jgi:Fe-S cluster assembly protein SufD